ncbi:MAG TPA: hypothetical protein VGU68_13000 [Ktedonobacteraceae bacterium]|nr:hypothetical protein [Ktedonobacteraceae bacterium]HEV2661518.1 hypothetical protein [Ktedonobacteraceae bacterium]
MQLHTSLDPLSSVRPGRLPAPRFMGLLIFGVLLALVGFSILISITFQHAFVPAPLFVRGGSVYSIPLVSGGAPRRSGSAGTQMQVVNHK